MKRGARAAASEAAEAAGEGVVSATSDATSATEVAAAGLPSMIEKQAALAVEEADVIVFVVDGQVRCCFRSWPMIFFDRCIARTL